MEQVVEPLTLIGTVVLSVTCTNLALSATAVILEKVMNHTKTETDNKLHAVLKTKVLPILAKAVDFLSANVAHKK